MKQLAVALVLVLVASAAQAKDIWVSAAHIASLPMTGAAWYKLVKDGSAAATSNPCGDHTCDHDAQTMAAALACARSSTVMCGGTPTPVTCCARARSALLAAIGSETGGNSLSNDRNLASYGIAADVLGLCESTSADAVKIKAWFKKMLTWQNPQGGGCSPPSCSIIGKHNAKGNNHGTMAGASRTALAACLGDKAEVARAANVYRAYIGGGNALWKLDYGDALCQAEPSNPVGINRKGTKWAGGQPAEMRRSCSSTCSASCWSGSTYPWEGLQGLVVQAELLERAGYDAYGWYDQAILSAANFLGLSTFAGDDVNQLPLFHCAYGTPWTANKTAAFGKNIAATDWTHGIKCPDGGAPPPPVTTTTITPPTTTTVTIPVPTTIKPVPTTLPSSCQRGLDAIATAVVAAEQVCP